MTTAPSRPQNRLGPVIREHRPRSGSQRGFTLTGWAIMGLAAAAGILAAGRGLFAYQAYGPLAVDRWAAPAAYAAGILALLGLVFLLIGRVQGRVLVRQHARGLVIERGRRGSAIPWDEIRAIHTMSIRYGPGRLPWGRQDELMLITRDGRRYRLHQALTDFDELVAAIKQGVYPRLLEAYTQSFNQAQPLPFGPLQLTPSGIVNGRKTLAWADVGLAQLDQGMLVVKPKEGRRAPRLRFPVRAVPNVDVCLQLIQELTSSQ
ncbi:MAG TPA: DUF6585 family protein [Anaerolineales bacterium]|nr:DUF6585 family protein [Anaerolineales bacterium]